MEAKTSSQPGVLKRLAANGGGELKESRSGGSLLGEIARRIPTGDGAGFALLASTGCLLGLYGASFADQFSYLILTGAGMGAFLIGAEGALGRKSLAKPRFRALARLLPACALVAAAAETSAMASAGVIHFSPFLLLGLALLLAPEAMLVCTAMAAAAFSVLAAMFGWPAAWLGFCLGLAISSSVRFFNEIRHQELKTALDRARLELSDRERLENELHRSQKLANRRYESLFESAPDIVFTILRNGQIGSLNRAFETITGFGAQDWTGKAFIELLHQADRSKAAGALAQALRGTASTLETRFHSKSKSFLIGNLTLQPQTEDGEVVGALGIARDVTEGRKNAQALLDIEQRFELVAQGAHDGLWDWNIKTKRFYFSPRWKQMLGFRDEEIGTSAEEWFGRVHPEDLAELRAALLRHLHGQTPHFEATYRVANKTNEHRWMSSRGLAMRDATGSAYRLVGSQTDITEFKQAEAQLNRDLSRDPLTGLGNRSLLLERLADALEKAKDDPKHRFALLSINLDRFSLLNDSLGHEAGDELLSLAARRLLSCVRTEDLVVRLGGDEFAVLAEGIFDDDHAARLAERIQKGLKNSFHIHGQRVFVSAGIGIARDAKDYAKPIEVLRDAGMALARAKEAGTGRVEAFSFEMRAQAVERLLMENDLRRAMKRREFTIHYQPLINMGTTELVGFEALLRWLHPEQGLIPPGEFLGLAEETGLIVPLTWWVLEQACRQTKTWQNQFVLDRQLSISVNLAPKALVEADATERITGILGATGLNPRQLKLEITEGVLMHAQSSDPMKKLHSLGISFFLDDFGKGLFPLGNLRRFPIEAAKIDCSFVSRVGLSPGSTQIVQAMVGLSHSLGLKVIAEGVETADQAAQLRLLRCELAQGFLYSKPLEAGAVERLLSSLYGARSSAQQPTLPVFMVSGKSQG